MDFKDCLYLAGVGAVLVYAIVLIYNLKLGQDKPCADKYLYGFFYNGTTCDGLTGEPANRVFSITKNKKNKTERYGQYTNGDIDGDRSEFLHSIMQTRPGTRRPHLISLIEPGKNF